MLVWLRSTQGRVSLVPDQYLANEVSEWECCLAKLRLSPEVEAAWGLLAHERSLRKEMTQIHRLSVFESEGSSRTQCEGTLASIGAKRRALAHRPLNGSAVA